MVRRETTNLLLVLVGGALVKITVAGSYLRFVKPSAGPSVLAAGAAIASLGLIAIIRDIRTGRPDGLADQHGHQHGSRSVLLLLLPVLAIFLVAPPALGADAVTRANGRNAALPAVVRQAAAAFPPLPAGRVVPIPLSEFITRSVWDASNSLRGRTVRLTGFVVHDRGAVYVARLVISCCAADATPMTVELSGEQAGGLPDDQWIQVDGAVRPGSATQANGYTPTLDVAAITAIPAPDDPYEY